MKIAKWLIIVIIVISTLLIAKWIASFFPSGHKEAAKTKEPVAIQTDIVKEIIDYIKEEIIGYKKEEPMEEVEIRLTFKHLEPAIIGSYNEAKSDINIFIEESMKNFQKEAKISLNKEDGFLDWLFDWATGYKLIWKKTKGIAGSADNEVKMAQERFMQDVLNYEPVLGVINRYSKYRVEEFYKTALNIVSAELNQNLSQFKQNEKPVKAEEIPSIELPWGAYLASGGTSIYAVSETAGLTGITLAGAAVAEKNAATIINTKMTGILSSNIATFLAGNTVALGGIFLAPVIAYATSKGVNALTIDDTRAKLEDAIDAIVADLTKDIELEYEKELFKIKNEIVTELNKSVTIKGANQ